MGSEKDTVQDSAVMDLLDAAAVKGLGPILIRRLMDRLGTWTEIKRADDGALADAGIRSDVAHSIRKGERRYDPVEQLARCRALGIRAIPYTSEEYPSALKPYDSAPVVLFVKGELAERDAMAVAVVGTRRSSLYGRMHAERLSFELAQAGFTIVSGLAHGIDAAAHRGALKAGGRTLAVLGNGLGGVYPADHEELAGDVAAHGALISELTPDVGPNAANFPPRNRIIAGLSLGTIVIEAPLRSGAVLTARLAGEMGKEVFAVPGDIGRPQARGVHQLIRDGAKLVESAGDVIEELGVMAQSVRIAGNRPPLADPRALTLNTRERAIYDLLASTPKDIDAITRESGLSPANVASTLMVLELKRLAVQAPGKRYARAFSPPVEAAGP